MSKRVKKVAAVHDLAGIGRCSLTAAIPILSVLGVQACPLPTAILSCQTDYQQFHFFDLTQEMKSYINSWNDMKLDFDGIYSGFLGSIEQIDMVIDLINGHKESFVLVDPVMGDNGEKYKTYTSDMCSRMKELIKHADVVTPNLTECCILTGRSYDSINIDDESLYRIACEISDLGPEKVIITGIEKGDDVVTFAYDNSRREYFYIANRYNGKSYSGTGDIFASIVCGMLVNGHDLRLSVKRACDFIKKAVDATSLEECDEKNGIFFEPLLGELCISHKNALFE